MSDEPDSEVAVQVRVSCQPECEPAVSCRRAGGHSGWHWRNNIVKIFTVTTSSNASACWWRRAIVASISPGASRWRRGEGPSDSDSRRAPRPAPVDVAAAGAARAPATPTAASLPTRRRSMAPLPARRGFQELLQPPRSPCGAGRCRRGEGPSDSNSRRAPRPAPVDGAAARAPATQTAIWPASPGACPPEARTPCQRLAGREL